MKSNDVQDDSATHNANDTSEQCNRPFDHCARSHSTKEENITTTKQQRNNKTNFIMKKNNKTHTFISDLLISLA